MFIREELNKILCIRRYDTMNGVVVGGIFIKSAVYSRH
jgi:hypothetical protein